MRIKAAVKDDEPVTDSSLKVANAQGRKRAAVSMQATAVRYLPAQRALLIGFADQSAVTLPVKNYPELSDLSPAQLKRMQLGLRGAALFLEECDLHISIAGLVSASKPLMALAATVVAAHNGRRSSAAKARASRENGTKGGRPRNLLLSD